jgi:ubiquinone biosynthesis monooxygenase Coq7
MPKVTKINKSALAELNRVNHAGEYGAKRIYLGQLSVLKGHAKIQEMYEQELEHLEYFDGQLKERKIRPTVLQPLWHLGGFMLGAMTAALGEKAAMACTVAVEEVIDEHYQEQLVKLQSVAAEKTLRNKIKKFREDELQHRDTGLEHDAEQAVAYPILYSTIKFITKGAIFLSKKY